MRYQGYTLAPSGVTDDSSLKIEEVQSHELDARAFWERYVSQRKPVRPVKPAPRLPGLHGTIDDLFAAHPNIILQVLIKGHFTDASWTATAKWDDNAYLIKTAVGAGSKRVLLMLSQLLACRCNFLM